MSTTSIPVAAAKKYAADAVQALPGGFGSLYSAAYAAQRGIEQGCPLPASVAPAGGAADSAVPIVVTGTAFVTGKASVVKIGGVACGAIVVNDDGTIHCTTADTIGAGTYDLTVENADGSVGTLPAAFTFA